MNLSASVVIPAYNEEAGIGVVIEAVRAHLTERGIAAEIIVVNDGSTDRTAEVAAGAGARVLSHRSNHGYGAALKTGISRAKSDAIVIIDADGTYPADRIADLLAGLSRADMVVGKRTGERVQIPWIRRPPKWVLTKLASYLTRSRIPDLNSGLRAFHRDVVLQYFPILPDQFSWTTTITLALHCDKYAVTYIPINYAPRIGASKIVPSDATSFLMLILRTVMLFRPLRVFLPIVVACLLYGVIKMSIDLVRDPNISATAILAFMSALLILLIGMVADVITTRLGRLSGRAVAGVLHDEKETDGRQ